MTVDNSSVLERLNPADSFTLAMDDEIRRDGLAGSYGCFALELSNAPDVCELQRRIAEFGERFPVAQAGLRQIGRRFYWCKRDHPPALFLQHQCPADGDETEFQRATIARIVNEKLPRETTPPIEFHLLSGPTKHLFFTRWLHPFGDARGADLILKFLCTADATQRDRFGSPAVEPLVYAQLAKYRWWQKIGLLWKGKRYIDSLDKLESIQPFDCDNPPQRLNYSVYRLDQAQTERILARARKTVGLTGTSLYYIGCLMRALEQLRPGRPGDAYCVPYAFNLRKQRALTPITGNHVCALFAQAPRDIVGDRTQLFDYLKQQNAQVIRRQQDYAFLPLMWAGSWLSLSEYGKTLRLSYGSGKERSSFWFSDIGRLDIPPDSFPGATIDNVFHVCQMTTPPGLAFLTCIFQGRLTLSYNYAVPVADSSRIDRLHRLMVQELLEDGR